MAEVLREAGGWHAVFNNGDLTAQQAVLNRLIEHAVPRRVGWGKYEVDITCTPLGQALGRLARSGSASAA